ncbi:MAG: tetratricopeptide repeat protein [Thermoplasmatota archaeon]
MAEDYEEHVEAVQELKRAEELFLSGEYEVMGEHLDQCIGLDICIGRAWELKGLFHIQEMDMESARDCFNEAMKCKGYFQDARGALYIMDKDEWPRGELQEDIIKRLMLLGNSFLNARSWPAAALCHRTVADNVEPNWELYSILGLIYREMDLLEPSLAYYEQARGMEGAPDEIDFDLSVVLIKLGRMEEAEGLLSQLAEALPGNPMVWNNLGTVLESQKRPEEAMEAYRNAAEADPDYFPALYSIGRLLQQKGKMDDAKAYMEKALDIEGRVFDLNDVTHRGERDMDGDLHVKEIMYSREGEDTS